RQVIDRGAQSAVDDHGVGPLAGQPEGAQQVLAVVADRRLPLDGQADVLELLAHVGEVRVDDLAGEDLVARADDLDPHIASLLYYDTPLPQECEQRVDDRGGAGPLARQEMTGAGHDVAGGAGWEERELALGRARGP